MVDEIAALNRETIRSADRLAPPEEREQPPAVQCETCGEWTEQPVAWRHIDECCQRCARLLERIADDPEIEGADLIIRFRLAMERLHTVASGARRPERDEMLRALRDANWEVLGGWQ